MSERALQSPDISLTELPQPRLLRLGVLASGNGSNLEAVAAAIAAGRLHAEVGVLIYNNPQARVAEIARDRAIPAELCNHRDYGDRGEFDRAVLALLQRYRVEWVVMAGWMRIVTEVLIDAYCDRIINIHPSLLPSFKGARAVERARAAGVKISGCTAHIVRREVDSGPILLQAAVPVFPDDTPASLHGRIQVQEHRILPAAIALAARNPSHPSAEPGTAIAPTS